jgi:hypothetical protein
VKAFGIDRKGESQNLVVVHVGEFTDVWVYYFVQFARYMPQRYKVLRFEESHAHRIDRVPDVEINKDGGFWGICELSETQMEITVLESPNLLFSHPIRQCPNVFPQNCLEDA